MHRRTFLNDTLDRIGPYLIAAVAVNPLRIARSASSAYSNMRTETPAPLPNESPTAVTRTTSGDDYHMKYHWHGRKTPGWELQFTVPQSTYHRAVRRSLGYATAFDAARQNSTANRIGTQLENSEPTSPFSASHPSPVVRFDRAVEFVRSLTYMTDHDSRNFPDYHRTVEETLVDGGGDCKDHTYLMAGILSQPPFEYRTAMVFSPGHMLLGVHKGDLPSMYSGFPTLVDTDYLAVESVTSDPIGVFDEEAVLAIYNDGFEYLDRAAIAETTIDFLRDPTESQIVSNVD